MPLEVVIRAVDLEGPAFCSMCGDVFKILRACAILVSSGESTREVLAEEDIFLCPTCLDAGPVGTAERAIEYARNSRRHTVESAEVLIQFAAHVREIPTENWATPKELTDAEHEVD